MEVVACGRVVEVRRARRTRSGVHEYFFVQAAPGDRIEVFSNASVMGEFPVRVGQRARVKGRYFHDRDGREGIDWTHHDGPGSRWPAGYVTLNGVTYR
ncbi:MAG TPA: hypothetical protein VNJ51_13395 [Candidatus Dormibacteraeota bacterium]|nr:hypothetical protein [Candidatus Dormibacteraeota bacterium]